MSDYNEMLSDAEKLTPEQIQDLIRKTDALFTYSVLNEDHSAIGTVEAYDYDDAANKAIKKFNLSGKRFYVGTTLQ
jgi:hypothetical protein